MPTQNRRVATYLPKELDDRLKAFIDERDLKGDSPALIAILSEYFGVAQQVAHREDYQANFATKDEVEELSSKLAYLTEQIQNFDRRLDQVVSKATSELKSELLNELPRQGTVTEVSPDQLNLLGNPVEQQDESSSQTDSIPSELLGGLSARKLGERFSQSKGPVLNRRDSPDFSEWSRVQDPDGIAWKYQDKKFYPVSAKS